MPATDVGDYYVYHKKDGKWYYDRTMPTKGSAEDRVKELTARGMEATYTRNKPMEGAIH